MRRGALRAISSEMSADDSHFRSVMPTKISDGKLRILFLNLYRKISMQRLFDISSTVRSRHIPPQHAYSKGIYYRIT